MCVVDWHIAKRLGLSKHDLFAPALSVSVADNSNLELIGAHFLELFDDSSECTEQLVYFANGVGEFYLSQEAFEVGRDPSPAFLMSLGSKLPLFP